MMVYDVRSKIGWGWSSGKRLHMRGVRTLEGLCSEIVISELVNAEVESS